MSTIAPRSRGLLQFSVIGVVVGVLMAALLNVLRYVEEQAERTMMEATVQNMNSGVQYECAARIMQQRESTLRELVGSNPVQWLEKPPDHYMGACTGTLAAGSWCFDEATQQIAYRPRLSSYLEIAAAGDPVLRWRVTSAAELAGDESGRSGPVGAIRLVSTTSFMWH